MLDKDKQIFAYRLYRQHTLITSTGLVKDLSKLGRDLSRIIMIDNIPENFRIQPINGLWIRTWNEEIRDTQLMDLYKLLKDIITLQPTDVRPIIKRIKDEVSKKSVKCLNPYQNIDLFKES